VRVDGALAGAAGLPSLGAQGSPLAGASVTLRLAHAKPTAPVILLIGVNHTLYKPAKGGLLVPKPDLKVTGLFTDASGTLVLLVTWPGDVAAGTLFALQAWVVDPAGPMGLAASNGLLVTAP
jgi:hypothetical protein